MTSTASNAASQATKSKGCCCGNKTCGSAKAEAAAKTDPHTTARPKADWTSGPIDVPKPLTEEQVKFFVEEGYLVVEGLMSDDEIQELRDDAITIARGKYPNDNIPPVDDSVSDQEVLENILCIHQTHFISPIARKYVKHPKICGILSQIVGAHLPFWDGSVKCMQSMMFVKPPQFQGQAWHQDEIYIPTRDRSLCGAWIAMDDATIENGCLWVLPGSHRMGYLYPQAPHNQPEEFDFAGQSYGFDDSGEVPVEVKAGAVVFFNGHLLHRSRKNRSNIYRRVLVNHYMNAWSLLPWHAKDTERNQSAASADVRRIVPVSGVDPYAYKGIEKDPTGVGLRTCAANQKKVEEHNKRVEEQRKAKETPQA